MPDKNLANLDFLILSQFFHNNNPAAISPPITATAIPTGPVISEKISGRFLNTLMIAFNGPPKNVTTFLNVPNAVATLVMIGITAVTKETNLNAPKKLAITIAMFCTAP